MTQTLQDNSNLNKGVSEYYQNSQSVSFTDPWFGTVPTNASNSVVWIRRRGIATTNNIGDSLAWSFFERTLQNWDFRYDPLDRKIYCYGAEYNNFNFIPDRWVSQRWWIRWEHTLYNWLLYECIQDADFSKVPWAVSWDWYRKPAIGVSQSFPFDNSSITMIDWFDWSAMNASRTTALLYTSYTANDDFWLISILPLTPQVPQDWYYLINTRETRWSRSGWSDVMSRIVIDDWVSQTIVSECYRYTPTITASSSGWITTTINQGTIEKDTTSNTRMWYLKKWNIVSVEARALWDTPTITSDFLQITKLF